MVETFNVESVHGYVVSLDTIEDAYEYMCMSQDMHKVEYKFKYDKDSSTVLFSYFEM